MSKLCVTLAIGIYISAYALLGFGREANRMDFLMSKPRPKLIIFSANWCLPCKVARKEMLENVELRRIVDSYEVIKYDFDLDKDAKKQYNVNKVPTYIIESDNKEVRRQIGYRGTKQLIEFLD